MFGNPCDTDDEDRARAAEEIHELLRFAMTQVFPDGDHEALASAGWGLAHGLACLHLDGKLSADSAQEVADRVRAAFAAILSAQAR
ncbi:WHG domain-containing protein [Nocardia mexicana]|uniref:WHG domain-containing protein n=2 Tax=Nocardia mexicana TaxID=279262 RepID=A0A370H4J6_9NOCA|nr:WHG domain-containing protein [Nocardia mexicana]